MSNRHTNNLPHPYHLVDASPWPVVGAAGVDDRTDQEVIEGEDGPEQLVMTIKGEAWDALRDIPGIKVKILAVAESETPEVAREWLGQLTLWPPGYEPCEPPIGAPELAQAAEGAS